MNGDDEALAGVLTEFHQRGREETRSTGVPPPLEVTYSVSHLGATRQAEKKVVDEPPPAAETPKLYPESDFSFGQAGFAHTPGLYSFTMWMQISCFHPGALPLDPLAIIVYEAIWWDTMSPPNSGNLSLSWDHANWWPAMYGQPVTLAAVSATWFDPGRVSPQHLRMKFGLRHTAPPYNNVVNIALVGQQVGIYWTNHREGNTSWIEGSWAVW
jgi:hypothetical protein